MLSHLLLPLRQNRLLPPVKQSNLLHRLPLVLPLCKPPLIKRVPHPAVEAPSSILGLEPTPEVIKNRR